MITCQFNDSYFPVLDGVGMTMHNYALWLKRMGEDSCAVAPKAEGVCYRNEYKALLYKSLPLPFMRPYRIGVPFMDKAFKQAINSSRFDLVHAHCPFVSGGIALKLAKRDNIPLVATFHSKYADDFRAVVNSTLFVNFMLKRVVDFYNAADHVWVPNQATGKTLESYGYRGEYSIFHNGTDFQRPTPESMEKEREQGLAMLNCSEKDFILLFVGQHRWEKNVGMIINSLPKLKERGVHFKMVFVGEGGASEEMRKMVERLALQEHVRFMGKISERERIRCIYASADLFIFPSIYDNAPLVMIEAAAYQVPSIVVGGSSAAECIKDNTNGFTIQNDPNDLARLITELSKDVERRKNAGIQASMSIYRTWESIVRDVREKYHEILTRHGK